VERRRSAADVSTLNASDGSIVANAAIVPRELPIDHGVRVELAHLILDINGYLRALVDVARALLRARVDTPVDTKSFQGGAVFSAAAAQVKLAASSTLPDPLYFATCG